MSLSIGNDKCQNTKVVNPVEFSQVQQIDETVKDPSDREEAGADEAERTKRNTRIPCVSQQAQSTRESQCRAKRRLTMNSREQHPRKRCQKREREREHEGPTKHEDRSILAHMSESRCAR